MRNPLAIFFLATVACNARSTAVAGGPTPSTQTNAAAVAVADSDSENVTIPIDGMSCGACAARLRRGLKDVDGVVDVEVSLEKSITRIRYVKTKTNPDKLVAAIRGLNLEPGTPVRTP